MNAPLDVRDYLVILLVAVSWIAATSFLFWKPTDMNFASWAGVTATLVGVYHWIVIRDSKTEDAQ